MKELLWHGLKEALALEIGVPVGLIEEPNREGQGDFALPCFELAKQQKRAPQEIAKEIEEKHKTPAFFSEVKAQGPYVNFYVDWIVFGQILLDKIDSKFGTKLCKGKVLIEHTSINPNASPHVGRSRNAIIGDTLTRILRYMGYNVESHYYVNDVGKQIALMVYYSRMKKIKKLDFSSLLKLYIEANEWQAQNPGEEEKVFKLLWNYESGNKKLQTEFHRFVDVALKGQIKVLGELNISYDKFDFESDYLRGKTIPAILKKLESTGKLFVDRYGRKVLDLAGFNIAMESPVLVLTRRDGTSLYQLRDIAYTLDKVKKAKDLNILILGEDQKLYFQQLSSALKILGYESPAVVHYSFILLPSGKMSTRTGNVVLLEDFMGEVKEKAKEEVKQRYPELKEKELNRRASAISIAAVRYSIIKVAPEKNVLFKLDEALKFEGDTGPYMLYTYARANSVLEKAKKWKTYSAAKLEDPRERFLLRLLAQYTSVLEKSREELRPHYLASYTRELADGFNTFYQVLPVLKAEKGLKEARLQLVKAVRDVLGSAMMLLGFTLLDEM
ncbi:MAG: arginine--tRNA ligase [Candidatus Aenigmarchaeota archaeon]|nr:arginine--tRNA ligase [Candidatus Aenigmarchaeota archaeon]